MNESDFREVLDSHGVAIVAGDLDRVLADFTEEMHQGVIDTADDMPRPLVNAEVLKVARDGERWVVQIRYVAEGTKGSRTIESIWDESLADRPLIVDAYPV
jgi:hypothetical protein